jgi:hypothetical protein
MYGIYDLYVILVVLLYGRTTIWACARGAEDPLSWPLIRLRLQKPLGDGSAGTEVMDVSITYKPYSGWYASNCPS